MNIIDLIYQKKQEYYDNFKKMPKIVVLHPETFKNAISSMRSSTYKEEYLGEYNTIFDLQVIESDKLRSDVVMVGG